MHRPGTPSTRRTTTTVALVIALALIAALPAAGAVTTPSQPATLPDGYAVFEGRVIDLSEDWGEATACVVWRERALVACYRSVAEMERATEEAAEDPSAAQMTTLALAACSSWLYLYEDPGAGGRTLQFRDRGYWQNLSAWGFSNRTSSFRTGACSVSLADYDSGGGSHYPGTTSANHFESSMVTGWDNRISSILIH